MRWYRVRVQPSGAPKGGWNTCNVVNILDGKSASLESPIFGGANFNGGVFAKCIDGIAIKNGGHIELVRLNVKFFRLLWI